MWVFGKLITVVGWYVVGSMIASSLDPKKKKKILEAEKRGENKLTFLFNDFIETHKKLAGWVKKELMSDENKKLFEQKKEQLMNLVKSYKKESKIVIEHLKQKAQEKARKWLIKIEDIYEQQKEKIEELKEISPEKATELKNTILAWAKEIKNKINKKIKK